MYSLLWSKIIHSLSYYFHNFKLKEIKHFILKYTFAIVVLIAFACACAPPKRTSFVIDRESVFTDSQKTVLNKLYISHEQKTTNEIVIYTTPGIEPEESIMTYGVKVGKELGVGKKDKNNGVLIVLCAGCRKVAICTGKGTEKILTDKIAKNIIDSIMTPKFRKGNYFEGIYDGSRAVISFLEQPGNEIK